MSDPTIAADVDTEGDGDTHDVPADLVELHEILAYLEAVEKEPNG